MNAFRKAKKEQAIAARKTARETAKVYEMTDSISNAIETYEKNITLIQLKQTLFAKFLYRT